MIVQHMNTTSWGRVEREKLIKWGKEVEGEGGEVEGEGGGGEEEEGLSY